MTNTLDREGLEAGRMAGRNYCRCTPPDCDCDERTDAAITAYLAATLPADVAALVERLRSAADETANMLGGVADAWSIQIVEAVLLREAATALEALSASRASEALQPEPGSRGGQ